MKLYMQQKVFSLKQDFDIFDVTQRPVYHVEGKLFSFGRQLSIYEAGTQRQLAEVKQKLLSFTPTMEVYVAGRLLCTIRKKITFFKPRYEVSHLDWQIEGDYFAHDYSILEGDGTIIADINKKFFSWSDTFEFDIYYEDIDPVNVVAVILAIDLAMDTDN